MEDSKDWENIARQLKANTSSEEGKFAFEKWLRENPENEGLFKQAEKIWELSKLPDEEYHPNVEKGWEQFQSKVNLGGEEFEDGERRRRFDFTIILKIAAILILVSGVSYYFFYNPSKDELVHIQTAPRETKEITLPDGSKVWLNRNSKLSFSREFDVEDRIVELTGEAFFEVRKADGETFTIFSNNAKTEVLGTEFNVRAYQNESEVQVTVVTGKVAFSLKNNPKVITLQPGDKGLLTEDNFLSKTVSENKNEVAWKTKRLIFENTHLKVVLKRLEEYFHTSIIANNQDILNCRFTGNFEDVELNQVLEVLAVSVDLKYAKKDNSFYLSGAGCK